jgi:hypothetical protein
MFAEFAAAEELALGYPADGCYARTHLMVGRLLDRGLARSKAWAFAAGATDLLWTGVPGHPEGRVQWGYHVAPVVSFPEHPGVAVQIRGFELEIEQPKPGKRAKVKEQPLKRTPARRKKGRKTRKK